MPRRSARRTRARRPARRVVALGLGSAAGTAVAAVALGTALAVWTTSGAGAGVGTTADLTAPTAVTATVVGSDVTVTWDPAEAPDGSPIDGYVVTRWDGPTDSPACGTALGDPGSYVDGSDTSCVDESVADGTYDYSVTAVFRSWSAESEHSDAVTVDSDGIGPTVTMALAAGPTGAALVGSTLWYRPSVAGSFRFVASVTDALSGPASAEFPGIAASGWSHAAETVTTGTGSGSTRAYTSSPYTWTPSPSVPSTHVVRGRDVAGNQTPFPVTFAADGSAPTGGSLTVNGVAATGAGSTSSTTSTSIAINTRVNYSADTGSGLVSSVLVRERATYSSGTCGTYGSAVTIPASATQIGLTSACYRFTLTGTDRVGNTSVLSTVVRLDTSAPTQTLSLDSATGAYLSSANRLYYKRNAPGEFVLRSTLVDPESGPASVSFPAVATTRWTHAAEIVTTPGAPGEFLSSTWSWIVNANAPSAKSIVGTNGVGATVSTSVTFVRDTTNPSGGSLRVNGTNSSTSATGSTSTNSTGTFPIVRTDYTEAQTASASGLASSILTRESGTWSGGSCTALGPPVTLVGAPTQTGMATGCYRYRITAMDNVGNTIQRTVVVRVT